MSPGPLTSDVPASPSQMGTCFEGRPRAVAPQRTLRNTLDHLQSALPPQSAGAFKQRDTGSADCAASTIMSNIYIGTFIVLQ